MRHKFDSRQEATRILSKNRFVQAEIYEQRDRAVAVRTLSAPLHSIWLRDGLIGVEAHVSIDGEVVISVSIPVGESAEEVAIILSEIGFCKLYALEPPLHSAWSNGEKLVTLDLDGWCDFECDLEDVDFDDVVVRSERCKTMDVTDILQLIR